MGRFVIISDMQRDDTDVVVKLKTESRGVVSPSVVRWIAFVVITVSLVACTVLCILAIWKFTESDAVWRAIATFVVVSIATAIFTFVNEKLG
jgi:Na+-transporting NADH:ubiquinone oxidoreductase subunit NqrB